MRKVFIDTNVLVDLLLERDPWADDAAIIFSMADRASTYRSVVVAKVNKIVYRIVDDRIEIADLWDCRREPDTLASQVK